MSYQLRSHIFQDLTSDEIAAAAKAGAMVLVPVGAIEQHAAHLPVKTDIFLSSNCALAAAKRVENVPVLIAPSLPFGFSPHHNSHAGTISLRLNTFLAVLRDVAVSLTNAGFGRIVFVNGHGGNNAPLRALVGELVTDGMPVAAVDYFAPGEREWVKTLKGALLRCGHACEMETALLMALEDPAKIEWTQAALLGLPARIIQPWIAGEWPEDPLTEYGAAWPPIFQADDCGYYGDPAVSELEVGEKIRDIIAETLALFLTRFAQTPLRLGVSRDAGRPNVSSPLADMYIDGL